MLEQYPDRVSVAELTTESQVDEPVDIVLYDAFAQPGERHADLQGVPRQPPGRTHRRLHLELPPPADRAGARGRRSTATCSKALPARDLVASLERVAAGETVISDPPAGPQRHRARLAGPRRGTERPRGGDPGADHPGQEQRRGGLVHLPQPQHDQVLRAHDLPQDRRLEAYARALWGACGTASCRGSTARTPGAPSGGCRQDPWGYCTAEVRRMTLSTTLRQKPRFSQSTSCSGRERRSVLVLDGLDLVDDVRRRPSA